MALFDTNLSTAVNILDKSVKDVFKAAVRTRLQAHADVIIEEAAEELVKNLMVNLDSVNSHGGAEVELRLRIFEKEKRFVFEKTVKEVPTGKI